MEIRFETPSDAEAIRGVVTAAFRQAEHSSGTEAAIVDALRRAGALTVSLVVEADRELIAHVAFSPITIEGAQSGWYGLGPVAVLPERQRRGIGQALVRAGLDLLERQGARGCVVLGDPGYYARFGFRSDPALRYGEVPPAHFQRLPFAGERPTGEVTYHPAFDAR